MKEMNNYLRNEKKKLELEIEALELSKKYVDIQIKIKKAEIRAEEYNVPWDEFENKILSKFRKAMGFKEEIDY